MKQMKKKKFAFWFLKIVEWSTYEPYNKTNVWTGYVKP